MPIYKITETKTAILRWEYTVSAEDEEEAIDLIQSGQVEADGFFTDEDPFGDHEYDVSDIVEK